LREFHVETQVAAVASAASAGARPRLWPRAGLLLRAALSVALLALVVHFADWPQIWTALRAVPMPVLLVGLMLMLVSQGLCAWRLQVLRGAQSIGIQYGYSLKLTLAAAFASVFLPSTVGGDALKILALRLRGHRVSTVLATVLIDRVSNLAVVAGLLVSLWWMPELLPLTAARWIGGGAAVLVAGGVLLMVAAFVDRARTGRVHVPRRGAWTGTATRWQRARRRLRIIVTRWWRHPQYVLAALALSLVLNLCVQVSLWLVARQLGLEISLVTMVAVTCLVLILSLAPISINALGLQEASLSYLLMQAGAPLGPAVAVAVLARCFQLASVLPGAACLVLLRREDPR
jgi:uncharacterized protein (TIRG00374 family)